MLLFASRALLLYPRYVVIAQFLETKFYSIEAESRCYQLTRSYYVLPIEQPLLAFVFQNC